jgi:TetR/AcrR family transcriptional regulator
VKNNRRQQILEILATELENKPGSRITTAGLAAAVGVSEAALYRHFPSKAKMFEALIEFAEDSVFGLINHILAEQQDAELRCRQIAIVLLKFAERNPGIARILMGDVLLGENERLRVRVAQFFQRIETQFKQVLREAVMGAGPQPQRAEINAAANLLLAGVTGRINQFVRSDFTLLPSTYWEDQWRILSAGTFQR